MTGSGRHTDASCVITPDEFRALMEQLIELTRAYQQANATGDRVLCPLPDEIRQDIRSQSFPHEGTSPWAILEEYQHAILPFGGGNTHRRYFAWIIPPPAPMGLFAAWLATLQNANCGAGDHAMMEVERTVLDWMKELVGYPPESKGILCSGGTEALKTCLSAARYAIAQRDGWNVREQGLQHARPPFTVYVSDQTHSCVRKVVEELGLGTAHLRCLPTDEQFRMAPQVLQAAIRADRQAGYRPAVVVATAGTTNTGAIDPLIELVHRCREDGLWLHVDGSYGVPAMLNPRLSPLFAGIEQADSLSFDGHKWLQVPYECGIALVHNGDLLRATYGGFQPPYLQAAGQKEPWLSEYGLPLSRSGDHALKLWMILKHRGRDGFSRLVARHVRLARELERMVEEQPELELLSRGPLAIVCFRLRPAFLREESEALNRLNATVTNEIQKRARVYFTGTMLKEHMAQRICLAHPDTDEDDLRVLLNEVLTVGQSVIQERS